MPNADAGPPIVNAVILPLLFLSGVFIAIRANAPAWMLWSGGSSRCGTSSSDAGLLPRGSRSTGRTSLVMAIWIVGAVVVASPDLQVGTEPLSVVRATCC